MNSNLVRIGVLMLLSGAAIAAPAPVTDLTNSGSSDLARLEQLIISRNQVQIQMQQQLSQLGEEVDELRGMVEQNSYELSQMLNRQRDLYREVDALSRQPAVTSPPQEQKNLDEPDVAFSADMDENSSYEAAVALILQEKDYAGAIGAFEAFLTQYPESTYSANSHYWLGQLYFIQSENAKAQQHFESVATFESSNKRADAMFKLGLIAERENAPEKAKQRYQAVIDAYPGSTSAVQAKTNLDKL
ncbi:tol-pal system protein YbgF [Thaumasiovibrio sp. DFM-14]|uniref:tol-pal system protein YbgF n=1 Tax=Thaumasiovibrio sp. DFM-14 TaxID=3384792 RepID=UPI00399EF036